MIRVGEMACGYVKYSKHFLGVGRIIMSAMVHGHAFDEMIVA
jgi:hypothetical protein